MTQTVDSGLVAQVPAHLRAVLAATQETLGFLFDAQPTFGQGRVCPAQMPREHEVSVIVGFMGDVRVGGFGSEGRVERGNRCDAHRITRSGRSRSRTCAGPAGRRTSPRCRRAPR